MFNSKKTLAGILSGFQKMADELGEFIDAKHAQIGDIQAKQDALFLEMRDASVDHSCATAIRQKIIALIEG